ncbi:uncharacterized protein LOC142628357 [Castanea sativa]|uniref:uncharacterized protein LOC142628357 n=1 Tax=Castanea sativa TaxID=21020 RepID=UPI003F6497B5
MINNQLPVALQSKLGRNYEIVIDGEKVKVSVVNNYRVLSWKIDEIKSLLQTSRSRVVGLDVKSVQDLDKKSFVVQMLVLSVGTRCLIIQFRHTKYAPDTLIKFLADDTICFVSTGIEDEVNFVLHNRHNLECRTGIKVGHFASTLPGF